MSSLRLVAPLVACLTSLGAISCGGDDPAPPEGGEDYALEVEAVIDAGRAEARLVLAYDSGVGALSRAVRGLAVTPAP